MAKLGPEQGHVVPTQTGSNLLLPWLNRPEPAPVAPTFLTRAVSTPILQTGQLPVLEARGPVSGPAQGGRLRPSAQARWGDAGAPASEIHAKHPLT